MMTLSVVPSDPVLIDLITSLNKLGTGMGFRQTERAFRAIATAISRSWQNQVGPGHRIETRRISPFTYDVFSKDKVVGWMENGLAPYDMKKTHTNGKKSRVVKARRRGDKIITEWKAKRKDGSTYTVRAGDSYLIIPFRHRTKNRPGTAGKMTLTDVYGDVRRQMKSDDFKRSSVIESANPGPQQTFSQAINRAKYDWGTRLEFPDKPEFSHLQGMVVMGPPKQSQFMSFRVVSVNSPPGSWLHPGIKARKYLYNIMTDGQQKIQNIIQDALLRDVGQ